MEHPEHERRSENMDNPEHYNPKPNIFQRLFFRRRTSSSSSEPTVGSPPTNDNMGRPAPRNRSESEGGGGLDYPDDMKFANPNEAIPMPWK